MMKNSKLFVTASNKLRRILIEQHIHLKFIFITICLLINVIFFNNGGAENDGPFRRNNATYYFKTEKEAKLFCYNAKIIVDGYEYKNHSDITQDQYERKYGFN